MVLGRSSGEIRYFLYNGNDPVLRLIIACSRMPARIFSVATIGLDGVPVEVEVDTLAQGLHHFTLVGLPDASVKESRDRVSSALKNSGFRPPHQSGRITVNLAPADLPKQGAVYDLPIALGYLLATDQLGFDPKKRLFLGELALDGNVRRVNGVLSAAFFAKGAGVEELYVPEENAAEAALVPGVTIYPVKHLLALSKHLSGGEKIPVWERSSESTGIEEAYPFDMAEVRGQEHAKRALEIAAAGGHNVIMVGPPGSGKTLLARALPSILPSLSMEESLEVTKIFSVSGKLPRGHALVRTRPFRAPHHSASAVSLVGGGSDPKPGEVSLAHRGVLFLDEFAEFPKTVLENLRQPLEDGSVTVSRIRGTHAYPARFTLVAAMNPCPCGYAGDPERMCSCQPFQAARYREKISGPILDRIDLQVTVPRLRIEKLETADRGEPSADIRVRVEAAREAQKKRFEGKTFRTNGEMGPDALREYCMVDESSKELLRRAVSELSLSARSYHRILKVSRTIADLEGAPDILAKHIAEALQYRFKAE